MALVMIMVVLVGVGVLTVAVAVLVVMDMVVEVIAGDRADSGRGSHGECAN